MTTPFRPAALLTLALVLGCGSRSNLTADASGQGGDGTTTTNSNGPGGSAAGGSGGASSSGGSSTGGIPATCEALIVLDTLVLGATGLARSPELALVPPANDVLLAHIQAPSQIPGPLHVALLDAFASWPPSATDAMAIDDNVLDLTLGPGPNGPVALIRHQPGDPSFLATTLLPQVTGIGLSTGNGEPLFAAAIPDRFLAAQVHHAPGYDVLGVGSYQPSSLPQSEEPLLCVGSTLLAAGGRSGGNGFLAAFTAPPPNAATCAAGPKPKASSVAIYRYQVPSPAPGTFLVAQPGDLLDNDEPVVLLGLAPTSFGAWIVFQTDGSTSESPPPIVAVRVDTAGHLLPETQPIVVSPGGQLYQHSAVAALDDSLVVAWIDALDPSAPTILVQIVRPDGSLGPAAGFGTNDAWFSGHLRLLPSPNAQSLLVAWEAGFAEAQVALTRIDCVGGL